MSEEVLNNLFELRNLEDDIARKQTLYRKIEKYITDLQQENKQLKEDKKKAREFIEKNFIRYKDSENGLVLNELSLINIEEIKRLLQILGGNEWKV